MTENAHLLWLIASYLFAVFVGDILIRNVSDNLWRIDCQWNPNDPTSRPAPQLPRLIGMIERVLYVTALLNQHAEFIGFWLALKVAGQWKRWTADYNGAVDGRVYFNVFLIGNGLSVAYAFAGYQTTNLLDKNKCTEMVALLLATILSTLALYFHVSSRKPVK